MKIGIKGYIVPDEDKEIYKYFGIESTCPADISGLINEAKGEPIDVEISTCYGGDVFAGSEIYTALKSYKGGVNITITALAASAASFIAMAGHCEMSPTAQIMVHNVLSFAEGNYHDMDKCSERLKTANKALASAYTLKSGMTEKEALKMMDDETWLTAQQAVDKKLVDAVMFADEGQLVAAYGSAMLPKSVIDKTRSILHPEGIPKNTDSSKDIDILKAKLALQLTL